MNSAIVWRMAWKDYRVLRGLWIAVAMFAVAIQLLIAMVFRNSLDMSFTVFAIAIGAPAFYALGCGAALFAAEHEENTFEFLRILPTTSHEVSAGKLAFAVVSTILLLLTLWLAAWVILWIKLGDTRVPAYAALWSTWGVGTLEVFAWGVLFSLLLRRPLPAACVAIAMASTVVHVIVWAQAPSSRAFFELEPYANAAPWRIAIAAAVWLVDIWLAARWLKEPTIVAKIAAARTSASERASSRAVAASPALSAVFAHLVWHSWRQSVGLIAIYAAVGLVTATVVLVLGSPSLLGGFDPGLFGTVLFVLPPIIGASVFLADQQGRQYRYFAERGVSPRQLWLSRHVVWLTAALLIFVAVQFVALWEDYYDLVQVWGREWNRWQIDRSTEFLLGVIYTAGAVIVAYTAGQLCSMFIRSGVLAGFLGVVLSALVLGWCLLMYLAQIPWTWSVAPLPLAMLLATWLRAPSWVLERHSLRAWLPPTLAVALPAALVAFGAWQHRVQEIPAVDLGISPEDYTAPLSPEESETVALYERARDLLVPWNSFVTNQVSGATETEAAEPGEFGTQLNPLRPISRREPLTKKQLEYVAANESALASALQASEQPTLRFELPLSSSAELLISHADDLGHAILASARKLEADSQLDEALDHYLAALRISGHFRNYRRGWLFSHADLESRVYEQLPYWAAAKGQTPVRIRGAMNRVQEIVQTFPSPLEGIRKSYANTHLALQSDSEHYWPRINGLTIPIDWIPGEQQRTLRLAAWHTSRDLELLKRALTAMEQGERVSKAVPQLGVLLRAYELPDPWAETTLITVGTGTPLSSLNGLNNLLEDVRVQTHHRIAMLLLAIEAWKAEHGELPDRLDQLDGTYLNEIPIDPYTGKPFKYMPEGLPLFRQDGNRLVSYGVAPTEPFVWSAGPAIDMPEEPNSPANQAHIFEGNHVRSARTGLEIWAAGWAVAIP